MVVSDLIRRWRLFCSKEQGTMWSDIFAKSGTTQMKMASILATRNYKVWLRWQTRSVFHLLLCQFWKEYWDRVFEYFLAEYRAGRTPNQMLCATKSSLRPFGLYAMTHGCRLRGGWALCSVAHDEDGIVHMLRGVDNGEDQTYFLSQLSQNNSKKPCSHWDIWKSLSHWLAENEAPCDCWRKTRQGLSYREKEFIKTFSATICQLQPGRMMTLDGRDMGEHAGLMYYTIGQRGGLGIGGQHGEQRAMVCCRKRP